MCPIYEEWSLLQQDDSLNDIDPLMKLLKSSIQEQDVEGQGTSNRHKMQNSSRRCIPIQPFSYVHLSLLHGQTAVSIVLPCAVPTFNESQFNSTQNTCYELYFVQLMRHQSRTSCDFQLTSPSFLFLEEFAGKCLSCN